LFKEKRDWSLTVRSRTLLWRQKQNPDLLQRKKDQPESEGANRRAAVGVTGDGKEMTPSSDETLPKLLILLC